MFTFIGTIISAIPKQLYWVIASVALIAGAWYYGHDKGYEEAEEKYLGKIAQIEVQAANLKAALEKANSEITQDVIIEYVDRERVVFKNKIVYRDVVKEVLVPSECTLTNGWVDVHDAVATQTTSQINEQTNEYSTYTDLEGLEVVIDNYSTCHQISNQLVALQDWVQENYTQINQVNE